MRLLYLSASGGSKWLFIHDLQPLKKGVNCVKLCKNELDISLKHWYRLLIILNDKIIVSH